MTTIVDVTRVLRLTISFVLLLPEDVLMRNVGLLSHAKELLSSHKTV